MSPATTRQSDGLGLWYAPIKFPGDHALMGAAEGRRPPLSWLQACLRRSSISVETLPGDRFMFSFLLLFFLEKKQFRYHEN